MSACGPLDRIRTTAVKRVCRGYFPLIHRFFRGFGVTEVPSHTAGRRGGGLNRQQPGQLQIAASTLSDEETRTTSTTWERAREARYIFRFEVSTHARRRTGHERSSQVSSLRDHARSQARNLRRHIEWPCSRYSARVTVCAGKLSADAKSEPPRQAALSGLAAAVTPMSQSEGTSARSSR
jgi:hypothetical protein